MSDAIKWWRSLSINEMKMYEKKHKIIYDIALSGEIEEMYTKEVLNKGCVLCKDRVLSEEVE